MRSRKALALTGCAALACASALGAWISAPAASRPLRNVSTLPAPKPRTLLSSPTRIFSFAQDRGSIAWVTGRRLHIRPLASASAVTIPFRPRAGEVLSGLVLAGTQALWHQSGELLSSEWAEIKMYTASLADPRVKPLPCCKWRFQDARIVIPRAGSSGMLVYYSHRDRDSDGEGDELKEYVIRRVDGGSTTKLFTLRNPLMVALDIDRGRIALGWRNAGEIRSIDGRLIASFRFRGEPTAVVLDGSTVTVLTRTLSGGKRPNALTMFDASSGARRGRVRVAEDVQSVSAGGGWVVYAGATGRSIRAFRARATGVRLHVRTTAVPIDLSVAGRRVAWAEYYRGRGRIKAFTLPR